jgi:hypothetical protein
MSTFVTAKVCSENPEPEVACDASEENDDKSIDGGDSFEPSVMVALLSNVDMDSQKLFPSIFF